MAWLGSVVARSRKFLWHSVTPPRRGGCLPAPARSPLAGTDRAHADRLRAWWWLSAALADTVGLPAPGPASSRSGHCRRLRRIQASDRLSAGRQSLWPQPLGFGAASPLFAQRQEWLVRLGTSPAVSGGDSRRGPIRLRRVVSGRLLQRHLLDGKSSQRAPISATVLPSANRPSGLRCHPK